MLASLVCGTFLRRILPKRMVLPNRKVLPKIKVLPKRKVLPPSASAKKIVMNTA